MKLMIYLFLAAWTGYAHAEPCTHTETEFRCVQVVRNYDADTITVNIPGVHSLFGKNVGVRILGIDTPEIKGANECESASAKEAKEVVALVLKRAKRVDLKKIGRDKYFRILAEVWVDESESIADVLISKGLAYQYFGETKRKWICGPDKKAYPAALGQ